MSALADPTESTRILLAVTGLSPQIVTETLYALAVEEDWIPHEIHLITTRKGAERASLSLLSDHSGWFHRLREDYDLPEIRFFQDNIYIIPAPDGRPLEDILTEADNEAVADYITEHVRRLTVDPSIHLHVTLAGGRKTMGFYVGYALSLFGRHQDRLSHVLVSPPLFESLAEFFYPAPQTRIIHDRNGLPLDASEGHVHLGEIPFVRLRDSLPKQLLEGRAPFSKVVAEAQKALPPVSLVLYPAIRTIVAADTPIVLKPIHFAFYWMMAERCRGAQDGIRRDDAIGTELLKYYGRLVNPNSGSYDRSAKAYRDFTVDNFDQTKTKVNKAITQILGKRLAAPYLVGKLPFDNGTRIHRFGLTISPGSIVIA